MYEKLCLLRCDAVLTGRSLMMFRRNTQLPSSGTKNKLSKQEANRKHNFRFCGLLFNHVDGGSMFLQNTINFYQTTQYHIPDDITL